MTSENQHPNTVDLNHSNIAARFYRAIPVYIAVPIAFWLAFRYSGIPMEWSAFGLGAAGWMIALALRGPIAVAVKSLPRTTAGIVIASASGPLEEIVRIVVLLLTARSLDWAVSLGQGWAAVEVLFTIVNGSVIASMMNRTDEKAMQVKQALEAAGQKPNTNPLWGVVERIFASAFHIGSTILIAGNFWLVLLMIPLHTGLNLIAVHWAKKSVVGTEIFIAIVGTVVLVSGLLVFI